MPVTSKQCAWHWRHNIDINSEQLFSEICCPYSTVSTGDFLFCVMENQLLDDVYSDLRTALRLQPMTLSEHSFSKLKLSKHYLQSVMGQEQLNDLTLLEYWTRIPNTWVLHLNWNGWDHHYIWLWEGPQGMSFPLMLPFLFMSLFSALFSLNPYCSYLIHRRMSMRDMVYCFQAIVCKAVLHC